MEEQAADVEVTVKTLDSQSRTYTVATQVILTATAKTFSDTPLFGFNIFSISFVVDCEGVQGAYCTFSGYPCGQTETDLPRKGPAGWQDSSRLQ